MFIKSQKGFTVLELAVSLSVLATVAALTTPNIMVELQERRAKSAIQETQLILDAARTYRMENGVWPGGSTCISAVQEMSSGTQPLLIGIGSKNRFDSVYSTSCTQWTFSLDQNAVSDWDAYIMNALPATTIVNASNSLLRTTVGLPGTEAAMDSKLSRLATGNADHNRMFTTLFLGGNDIREIGNLQAQSATISGNLDVNTANVSGQLQAGSANVTGNLTVNSQSMLRGATEIAGALTTRSTVTNMGAVTNNGAVVNNSTMNTVGRADFRAHTTFHETTQFTKPATFNSHVVLNNTPVTAGSSCAGFALGSIGRTVDGGVAICKQGGLWSGVGGASLGTIFESGRISYHDSAPAAHVRCPSGSVLVGMRAGTGADDYYYYQCQWLN